MRSKKNLLNLSRRRLLGLNVEWTLANKRGQTPKIVWLQLFVLGSGIAQTGVSVKPHNAYNNQSKTRRASYTPPTDN